MGEILQARHDHLADLTQAETLALLAIANRCKPKSRLASVAFQEIRDAIGFAHRSPQQKHGLRKIAFFNRSVRPHCGQQFRFGDGPP